MSTTTTTTRSHRGRRVAAAVLVGLGLVSLGVASASKLTVTANGDLVASGAVGVQGFLGPNATAEVTVTYDDVDEGTESGTLAGADTLQPTVTLTIDPGTQGELVAGDTVDVYFYSGDDVTMKASITLAEEDAPTVQTTGIDIYLRITDGSGTAVAPGALLTYDRVAVVAVSSSYPTPTPTP